MRVGERVEYYENRLQELPRSKRFMLYAALFLVAGYLLYAFLFEPQLEQLSELESQAQQLRTEVAKSSPRRYERLVVAKKQDLAKMRQRLDRLKQEEFALLQKLHMQEFLFLHPQNFAQLLEDILAESKKRGIALTLIEIDDEKKPFMGRLYQRKRLLIEGKGEFLQDVGFLRAIEAHPMLLRIDDLQIETNGSAPRFRFSLHLYGVDR